MTVRPVVHSDNEPSLPVGRSALDADTDDHDIDTRDTAFDVPPDQLRPGSRDNPINDTKPPPAPIVLTPAVRPVSPPRALMVIPRDSWVPPEPPRRSRWLMPVAVVVLLSMSALLGFVLATSRETVLLEDPVRRAQP